MTIKQQQIFLDFINRSSKYSRWKNIFTIFLGTGMRCSEFTGLTWDDIDFENNLIYVRRDLVYFSHVDDNKCYYDINPTKTPTSTRAIGMVDAVRQAFLNEREYYKITGITCKMTIRGLNNFCILTKEGRVFNQQNLNRVLKRIVRDANNEIFDKNPNATDDDLLPSNLSTHIFRHSVCTRLLESGCNIRYISEFLGHKNSDVTLDVYSDILEDFRQKEVKNFNNYLNKTIQSNTTPYDIPYDIIVKNGVQQCTIS